MKLWICLECGARWLVSYKQHCHCCESFNVKEGI
nr:MAG TPA: Rubredoxin metal binding domain [Caudoviricetes sp.]